ncbi:hypothetical protein L484_025649 [Morus notabilis]|uniref:Uncharacterized protein n=1 Tax=Morus notabilis TaxID=981085 RepID=W9R8Y7_9ROSA|nr:hypothetical protein L484_025649 [Morus notabilis]
MQRSSSTSRASDDFLVNFSPTFFVSSPMNSAASDDLPLYDPNSEATKKEIGMHKLIGENAIHIIPLVLLLCGFILWIFSHPAIPKTSYLELQIKSDSRNPRSPPKSEDESYLNSKAKSYGEDFLFSYVRKWRRSRAPSSDDPEASTRAIIASFKTSPLLPNPNPPGLGLIIVGLVCLDLDEDFEDSDYEKLRLKVKVDGGRGLATLMGRIRVAVAHYAPRASHLFFVNDSIIFSRARREEGVAIVDVFDSYAKAIEQNLNFAKSMITFSPNVSVETKEEIKTYPS